jgi:hypothetical protein
MSVMKIWILFTIKNYLFWILIKEGINRIDFRHRIKTSSIIEILKEEILVYMLKRIHSDSVIIRILPSLFYLKEYIFVIFIQNRRLHLNSFYLTKNLKNIGIRGFATTYFDSQTSSKKERHECLFNIVLIVGIKNIPCFFH